MTGGEEMSLQIPPYMKAVAQPCIMCHPPPLCKDCNKGMAVRLTQEIISLGRTCSQISPSFPAISAGEKQWNAFCLDAEKDIIHTSNAHLK